MTINTNISETAFSKVKFSVQARDEDFACLKWRPQLLLRYILEGQTPRLNYQFLSSTCKSSCVDCREPTFCALRWVLPSPLSMFSSSSSLELLLLLLPLPCRFRRSHRVHYGRGHLRFFAEVAAITAEVFLVIVTDDSIVVSVVIGVVSAGAVITIAIAEGFSCILFKCPRAVHCKWLRERCRHLVSLLPRSSSIFIRNQALQASSPSIGSIGSQQIAVQFGVNFS